MAAVFAVSAGLSHSPTQQPTLCLLAGLVLQHNIFLCLDGLNDLNRLVIVCVCLMITRC